MIQSNFDVVVVGAGSAGLTAAIGLARAGFSVVVLEAASFPGAENWSGCVYFCENLVHPDILGPDGVEALAWERRLVERGFFATDGHGLLGMTYRDPEAFRHCYTVLRPIYDHHLAQGAIQHGVNLLAATTVESLIRDDGRIIGVCTNRGALYAPLVFLAEGDASHLVTREAYERYTDQREAPKFLQGIKQVLELPPGKIEERFGVGPEQGVAYEMLLRNGTLNGRKVRLNMGGFLYTNRESLSIGLVLPADNLANHFGGDPNLLMEWFENLPSLRPWLREGKRGAFGAKLIRGGGAKDIPILIDDGLAIGGAASAIGIDFPYPNFTGPATAMGLLLAQAACAIRAAGGEYTRDNLRRYYLEPLQRTHYWKDVEFLRRWPGYVKRTRHFFGRNLDAVLGSAYVWTRSDRWTPSRWTSWLRMLLRVVGPGHWPALQADARHLVRALRLQTILPRPTLGRLLLDGTVNAFRDALHRPRRDLPSAGQVRLYYSVAEAPSRAGRVTRRVPPALMRRWFRRFAPVLASAARYVYVNDATPLAAKLPAAVRLLVRQINLLDLIAMTFLGMAAAAGATFLVGWDRLLVGLRRKKGAAGKRFTGLYGRYTEAARRATDLTPVAASAAANWEQRLAQLEYEPSKASHIHVLWPKAITDKNAVVAEGLWHVCPAHVYEARTDGGGQVQVVVNFENCIKCETCWRTSDLVDWGRDGLHRFVYAVYSPPVKKLLAAMEAAGSVRARPARAVENWSLSSPATDGLKAGEVTLLQTLLGQLERKLEEYDDALAAEPRRVDRSRSAYLEMLARYGQQLAIRIHEVLRASRLADRDEIIRLADGMARRAEERARRVWQQRFAWAAADGRQLRQHHLAGLRRLLGISQKARRNGPSPWLGPERALAECAEILTDWRRRLDAALPATFWRDFDRGILLTAEQDTAVRALLAEIPALDPEHSTVHPPLRKLLLAELGRRDPSLAYRAAAHLCARDLGRLAALPGEITGRWTRGDEWACLAILPTIPDRSAKPEALLVLAQGAFSILVLDGKRLLVFRRDEAGNIPGLVIDPLPTLGLRGAGLARVELSADGPAPVELAVDAGLLQRAWRILSAADLVAIAVGMTDLLCQRTVAHASSRVQFPGLFHDEEACDTIGKFGAIKKMVANVAARSYLLETLAYNLSPADFSSESAERAALVKAVAAEILGTAPGSVTYDAGQVFGGTGYSEDDIVSKYFRDAAAWRFLGPDNVEVFAQHGVKLLASKEFETATMSRLPDDETWLDEAAQRKALQAELDEVRVHRSRLRGVLNQWRDIAGPGSAEPAQDEVSEAVGRQDAYLLASKALLLRTHARLEQGHESEAEFALLRVWLESAATGLEKLQGVVRMSEGNGVDREEARPITDPGAGPPITIYEDFLKANCPYESGDFLVRPTDLLEPRFVPEMITTDPALAAADRRFRELLTQQFGALRDGLPYERYIERRHRPDTADLDFCRQHGFFRMPIPTEQGGEGRSKVAYYLLTTNTNRIADVCLSLTIQVNSSLGTTPVLLARNKDLPRAQKEASASPANYPPDFGEELSRRREAYDLFLRWVASGQISGFALTEPSAGSDTARVATRAHLRSVPVETRADGVLHFVPQGGKEIRYLLDARRLEFRATGDGPRAFYRWSDTAEPALIHFDEYDYETDDPRRMRYYDHGSRRVYFTDIAQLRERDGRLWYDYWELSGAKMWITNGRIAGILCLYAKTDKGVTGFIVDRHAQGLVVGKDEEKMGQCGSPTNELSLQGVRVPQENVIGLEGRGQVNALETLNVGRAGLAMSAMAYMKGLIDSSRHVAEQTHGSIPAWAKWRLERMEEERFIAESIAHEVIGRFEHPQTKSVRMESAIAKMLVSELYQSVIEMAEDVHGVVGQTQHHLVEKRKRDARVLNIYEGTNEIQRFFILKDLVSEVAPRWQSDLPRATGYLGPEALELEALKGDVRKQVRAAVETFGKQLWQNANLQANCFLLAEAVAWLAAAASTLGRLAWLSRREMADENAEPSPGIAVARRAVRRCQLEVRERLKLFDDELTHLRRGYYAPQVRAASLLFRDAVRTAPASQPASSVPLSVLVILDTLAPGVPHPRVIDGRLMEPYRVLSDADRSALEVALRLRDVTKLAEIRIEVVAVGPPSVAPVLREALSLGVNRVRLVVSDTAVSSDRAAAALAAIVRQDPSYDLVLGGGLAGQEGVLVRLSAAALGVRFAGGAAHLAVQAGSQENRVLLTQLDGRQPRVRGLPAAIAIEAGLSPRSFTVKGYLAGLAKAVEILTWPSSVNQGSPLSLAEAVRERTTSREDQPRALSPLEAGRLLLENLGLHVGDKPQSVCAAIPSENGSDREIASVERPAFAEDSAAKILALVGTDAEGRLRPSAAQVFAAAELVEQQRGETGGVHVLVLASGGQQTQQEVAREIVRMLRPASIAIVPTDSSRTSDDVRVQFLAECLQGMSFASVVGETWTEGAVAELARGQGQALVALKTQHIAGAGGTLFMETTLARGKLRGRQEVAVARGERAWITLSEDAAIQPTDGCHAHTADLTKTFALGQQGGVGMPRSVRQTRVEHWAPRLDKFYARDDIQELLSEIKQAAGVVRLSDAEFIVDIGFGVSNRDGYEAVVEPLEQALRGLGVRSLVIGGSRKVTEELHLLPADRQIGQSGVSVNPRILLAIGISGAPQHLNYIGPGATIVAFNRDSEAPIMTLNQRQAQPRVFPVVGDLFDTVPAFTAALQGEVGPGEPGA
jgi:electron transfer flavoprotein-quinone oxidoreductase